MWTDRRLIELFGVRHPIVQAPMAGAMDTALAIAVAQGGGLGSLPAAMLDAGQLHAQAQAFRAATDGPLNLNFFTHTPPVPNNAREHGWRERLKPYYAELGVDPGAPIPTSNRAPFDAAFCAVVEEIRPEVVSFHYGLPADELTARVKAAGCKVISSATTVEEARWLDAHGCDAIIAQGVEAGGHRGMFLTEDVAAQMGTFALVPSIARAVKVPVIAAGGIGDAHGIAAALALGAAGVQIGTGYLHCPESKITAAHRALLRAGEEPTVVTHVMTGRPARGFRNRLIADLGPLSDIAPAFPLAGGAIAPLGKAAQAKGSGDFSSMWAGQAVGLGRDMPARDLTETLAAETLALLKKMAG